MDFLNIFHSGGRSDECMVMCVFQQPFLLKAASSVPTIVSMKCDLNPNSQFRCLLQDLKKSLKFETEHVQF